MQIFDVILPSRFVEQKDFGKIMTSLQSAVKTNNSKIFYEMIIGQLSNSEKKLKNYAMPSLSSPLLLRNFPKHFAPKLSNLSQNEQNAAKQDKLILYRRRLQFSAFVKTIFEVLENAL